MTNSCAILKIVLLLVLVSPFAVPIFSQCYQLCSVPHPARIIQAQPVSCCFGPVRPEFVAQPFQIMANVAAGALPGEKGFEANIARAKMELGKMAKSNGIQLEF